MRFIRTVLAALVGVVLSLAIQGAMRVACAFARQAGRAGVREAFGEAHARALMWLASVAVPGGKS